MEERNYLVLAQYRQGSDYADEVGRLYHFPRKYFNQLTLPAVEFIYFEPKKSGKGEYFGYGRVGRVYPDPENPDHFYAEVFDYRPFSNFVPGVKRDRKSTRLNSSHGYISYAVFCLKKKKYIPTYYELLETTRLSSDVYDSRNQLI